MSLRVAVLDEQTGEIEIQRVADGTYLVLATEPCHVESYQTYRNGTNVLTIKENHPKPLPPKPEPTCPLCGRLPTDPVP